MVEVEHMSDRVELPLAPSGIPEAVGAVVLAGSLFMGAIVSVSFTHTCGAARSVELKRQETRARLAEIEREQR